MRTITLGKSGISVSAVGLGGIQFSKVSRNQVARIVGAARDSGVNFFETAHGYFDSEEKLGYVLKGKRNDVILATKSPFTDAKAFGEALNLSLKRLRTDMIDIHQLHGVDSRETLDRMLGKRGAMTAARKALRQGKIRSIGITSHSMDICLHVVKLGIFDTIQYPISLINTEVPRSGLLGAARKHNVGLIAMKPLGGGRITNPRLALGYIYRHPRVVPVVGVETADQVRELARIAERPPRLGRRQFEQIQRIRKALGTTFCRACRYCEPCPQRIRIFQVMYLPIYIKQIGAKRYFADGIPKAIAQAEQCTECGQCETRCPFGLHIVESLKGNLALARRSAAAVRRRR